MAAIDRTPTPPREPIRIAGDLVRRSDGLSKEAAVCIRDLRDSLAECVELLEHHAAKYRPHLPVYESVTKARMRLGRNP